MIRFGTDGWRARLDDDFTEENLVRIADATGRVWARSAPGAIAYVGYDTRPAAERFALLAGRVLAAHGLVVKAADRAVPTPALSWMLAHDQRAVGGLMVTGSHNPPDYLGVKLRMEGGGTLLGDAADEIEAAIDPSPEVGRGPIQRCDLATSYLDHLCSAVDADAIARAHLKVVYDPLYGSARGYVPQVLGALGVDAVEIHGRDDLDRDDIHPDPIEPWVDDCERAVVAHGAHAGLVTGGDADRVGAVDETGAYVSANKIIALITRHLIEHRGMTGRVVLNQSTSVLARRAARELGCRVTVKPVGFKHLYEEILKGDVLLAGEEAGNICVPAICPERDGILACLLLLELMAKTGKTLGMLVNQLERDLGATSYARRDLRVPPENVEMLSLMLPGVNPTDVAGQEPVAVSHMDGLRLEFADESWLLFRPSGTEPVVRVYAEAPTVERRDELIDAGCSWARGEQPL